MIKAHWRGNHSAESDSAINYGLQTLDHLFGPAAREIRNRTPLDTEEVAIPGDLALAAETTMTHIDTHSNQDEIHDKHSLVEDRLLVQVVDGEGPLLS